MLVGITGTLGAGKGTVAGMLKKQSFSHYSVREFLNEEIIKRGLSANRDNQVTVANDLRKRNSPSYIVEQLMSRAEQQGGDAIIESIRCPGEAVLFARPGAFLLAVNAGPRTRYQRIRKRKSDTDDVSYEKFLEDEIRESASTDPSRQNLLRCISMADACILNDGTLPELKEQVTKACKELFSSRKGKQRPSWDEYFMKVTALVAERSTCRRHHVGAVIVKNRRMMTTGYNGAPRGVDDCLKLGCLRDQKGIPSGSRHEICRAIHAEQNAIIQAGVHGINVDNSVMYCTHSPCMICAKMIVNAGIREFVTYQDYADADARDFLEKEAGMKLRKVERPSPYLVFKD
jgi:dCMP deaminase